MSLRRLLLALALATAATPLAQQPSIDRALAREIDSIPAIDNHAHPMRSPPADAADREFDPLPVDSMEPESDPLAWRLDFPALADAWRALYGFAGKAPLDEAGMKALDRARAAVKKREGEHYSAWVLDRAEIGTMVANRVAMGTGVEPPRFLWVPYDDALLFPLDNSALARVNGDRAAFFPLEDKLRARYWREVGVSALPATLDEYVSEVVMPTLARQHAGGAIAVKFELAYLRPLDIGDPIREEAAAAYARWHKGGEPDGVAYKALQDFLFRTIAAECGRLGMAVHFHGMAGAGRYFSITGANPLKLERLLNDPRMKGTK